MQAKLIFALLTIVSIQFSYAQELPDSLAQDTLVTTESSEEGGQMLLGSCDNTPQWSQIGSTNDIYKCETAGKVGIGTSAPTTKLDVVSIGSHNGIRANSSSHQDSRYIDISSTGANYIRATNDLYISSSFGSLVFEPASTKNYVYNQGDLYVTKRGSFGIATTQSPDVILQSVSTGTGQFKIQRTSSGTQNNSMVMSITSTPFTGQNIAAGSVNFVLQNTNLGDMSFSANNQNIQMVIKNNGKVGIGTLSPAHPLTVKGAIAACEVIVENTWCDYVFAPDYNLKSLEEVEQFIKANRHLPGIPSEKNIIDEGLNLGDMQRMQMEKIEELILYVIQQQKELNRLKEENVTLQTLQYEIEMLKQKVITLSNN